MFSVDSAMNRYSGVSATGGARSVERPSGEASSAPSQPGGQRGAAARPSAVVNISEQAREQLSRASAAEAASASGRAEPVRAVDQAMVATNETNALQSRDAEGAADLDDAAPSANMSAATRADPNVDALARNAGPAGGDMNAAQQRDAVRVN